MSADGVLAGPARMLGSESLSDHRARLGSLPARTDRVIGVLDKSQLRGRGGASFPVGAKWRSVAERRRGSAVVLANGAEGEPLSAKDSVLMECRPHLVIDGVLLAAAAVRAEEAVVYVGEAHSRALAAMERALSERDDVQPAVRIVTAPDRYVAGEESAAVHCVNESVALPLAVPPRPYERGVGGKATLVQNVETLAHAGLIARRGDDWFRDAGRGSAVGTALITVSVGGEGRIVLEVAQGTPIGEAVAAAIHGSTAGVQAVLLGGFFGGWVAAEDAWTLPLDSVLLRAGGRSLGCGVLGLLRDDECGVQVTADIARYLADASAQQCGPCVFGLRAIASALQRVADNAAGPHDVAQVRTWAAEARGRGACRHPDGAAGMVLSALEVFEDEFLRHGRREGCSQAGRPPGATQWTR